MTDKVDLWIWYLEDNSKIKKVRLRTFLKQINTNPYYNRPPIGLVKKFFATEKEAKLEREKVKPKSWHYRNNKDGFMGSENRIIEKEKING